MAILGLLLVVAVAVWMVADHDEAPPDPSAEADPATRVAPPRAPPADASPFDDPQPARITGVVRDQGGAPIIGARVCGFPRSPHVPEQARYRPSCTLSEVAGHYAIEGPRAGRYAVMGAAAG